MHQGARTALRDADGSEAQERQNESQSQKQQP